MIIGLVDVDGHAKKKKWGATIYPNLALAKLARYHRERGDAVEWAIPLQHYDIVYKSKVFNFSPDDDVCYNADTIVKGGTGYDIASQLPDEIDRLQPDYSIYPQVDQKTAFGFLTRGCPNRCPWCVVPRKEGKIRQYMDVDEIAIDGRTNLVLMDNNILATGDYAMGQFRKIINNRYRVDFNQGLDARLVNDDNARLLARIKWIHNRVRFGCDNTAQIGECDRAIALLQKYGFKGEIFLYTMIGGKNDIHECLARINHWRERMLLKRNHHIGLYCYAYAQPYRDPGNTSHSIPQWQKDMAAWCNKRMIFVATSFKDFSPRKGFYCKQYLM